MSYGIGGLAAGFTQGLDDHRQIKRQQGLDEMDRERHDLAMQTGQSNLQAAEQQYGIRGAEHEAWQEDRGILEQERSRQQTWERARRQADVAGDFSGLAQYYSEHVFDGMPVDIQPGKEGVKLHLGDQETQIPLAELQSLLVNHDDPAARTRARMQIQQQIAEQQQGQLDHQRKMEIERTKGGYGIERSMIGRMAPGSVGIGEEGGFTFQEGAGGPGGANQTARGRDVQALARAQGISEGEAWDRLLNASGTPPEVGIPNIAKMLMSASYEMQDDPDAAFQRAEEMYHRYRGMQSQGQQGGYAQEQGRGGDIRAVTEFASQAITQQKIDREIAEATEAVQQGVNPAEAAGMMIEQGVPEEVVQRWQQQVRGQAGQSQPMGIGESAFDQWRR